MTDKQTNGTDRFTPPASTPPVVRGLSVVEMAGILILSEPIHLVDVRDGLARGAIKAAPARIDAWPLLLTRDQLCRYLQASWSTLSHTCPVDPIDLGVNLIRYSRPQIDDWIATLPARGQTTSAKPLTISALGEPLEETAVDARLAALEMARARQGRRG